MLDETQSVPEGAKLQLSPEEAIVLFDLLSRGCGDRVAPTPDASCFQSTAEGAVLHNLLADLERQLAPPFKHDFGELLNEARDRLERSWGYPTLRG